MAEVPDLSGLTQEAQELPPEVKQAIQKAQGTPEPSPFADAPVPGGKIQVITEIVTLEREDGKTFIGDGLGSCAYSPLGVYISPEDGKAILVPYDRILSLTFDYDVTNKLIDEENAKAAAEAADGASSSD